MRDVAPAPFAGTERYLIERELGAGGMGVVYRAFDRERAVPVALKTLRHVSAASIYRLKQEFRSLADVSHPNLVSLYELVSQEDTWFITMELVEGTSFLSWVRESPAGAAGAAPTDTLGETFTSPSTPASGESHPSSPPGASGPRGELRLDRLRPALQQLAEGVRALHRQGKLHRDIKPSNVLVTSAGRVVLLDFGLVTELQRSDQSASVEQKVAGTAAYMAPEQGAGFPLSEASDWYSVGVMLYEALTGRRPFHGGFIEILVDKQKFEPAAPAEVVPGLPEDLNALCVELLRRRPEQRPAGKDILRRLGCGVPSVEDRAVLPPTSTPQARALIGRREQLSRLREALLDTRAGRAVAVYVEGVSGVGKTALVQHFLDGLDPRERSVVLQGRCYERESVPYKALDSVIDALSRHLMGLKGREAAALLPRDCHALVRLFPVLRRVGAIAAAPQRGAGIPDPQELRRRAQLALRELLARLADRHPLILAIDDLQWGDLDSAALLSGLLRPPDPPALLLVGCFRSEDAEASALVRALLAEAAGGTTDARRLAVDPLSAAESEQMALALLGAEGEPGRHLAHLIARESAGNPFFVDELVRHLQAGASLEALGAAGEAVSLGEMLRERIERLPPEARRLLEVVAVAGRPVEQALAARAAELAEEERSALAVLRAGHFLRTRGAPEAREVETYHDRVRESAVSLLEPEALRDCHRRLAIALEGSGRADAEGLAVHFRGAGEHRRAAEQAVLAADRAAEALAFDRAARLYRLAIELKPADDPEVGGLWPRLGEALANAGRGPEAASAYLEAVPFADAAQALEMRRRAAEQLLRAGHVDEGRRVLESVLAAVGMRLPRTPRAALASVLLRRALVRLRGLGFQERDSSQVSRHDLTRIDVCWAVAIGLAIIDNIRGADYQARHLLLALRAGEPYRVARAIATEAGFYATGGGRARRHAERLIATATALAERIRHPHALGLARLAPGIASFYIGRFRAAREHCEAAEVIFRDRCRGTAWEVNTAQRFSFGSMFYLGEVAELARRVPERLREAREHGDLYAATDFASGRSNVAWLVRDDVAEARRQVVAAMSRWSVEGFHAQHFFSLLACCQQELYTGEPAPARARVLERWRPMARSLIVRVQLIRIEVLHLRGRCSLAVALRDRQPGLAAEAERDARAILRERMSWAEPLAWLLRAGAAGLRGRSESAARLLAEAAAGFDAAEMRLYAAAARRRRGQVLGGDAGRALVAEADAWMTSQSIRNPARMTAMLAPGFPD